MIDGNKKSHLGSTHEIAMLVDALYNENIQYHMAGSIRIAEARVIETPKRFKYSTN